MEFIASGAVVDMERSQFNLQTAVFLVTACCVGAAAAYLFGLRRVASLLTGFAVVVAVVTAWSCAHARAPALTRNATAGFIAGMLLSAILPFWLLRSREQTRRAACGNNLVKTHMERAEKEQFYPGSRGTISGNAAPTPAIPSATAVSGIWLEPQTVLGGEIALLIPHGFDVMSDEMLRSKYPSEPRPTLVYSNDTGSVNIAINHTNDRMPPDRIAAFHTYIDTVFRRTYPSATWYRSEVTAINDRTWFVLDLRTPAIDTEVRNIMAATSLEDRLLLVSFNVTRELERDWLAPGHKIVHSLRVMR